MSTIINLKQGSPEWHEHRRAHRNASETAAVLGLSPYVTAYQLWLEKTGRVPPQAPTAAMEYGTRKEPLARAAYEERTGNVVEPVVVVDGDYSASLDGMTLDGLIVEIKCPAKGKASALWQAVSAGETPIHYQFQIATQLMVSGAELAHLYVYVDAENSVLLEHKPDRDIWEIVRDGWGRFWQQYVVTDRPPPLTDRDTLVRTDEEWNVAAHDFVLLHDLADDVAQRLDVAKKKLIELAQHTSEIGGGVSVTRYWKSGAIDYKKIAQIAGVDVERYRAPARQEVRVSVMK